MAACAAILGLLVACGSNDVAPAAPPPHDDAGDEAGDGGPTEGDAGPDTSTPRGACRPLPDFLPYVGEVFFARSGNASSGAWVFAHAYRGPIAPLPGAGFAAIVLDRDSALVEAPVVLASVVGKLRGAPLIRPYLAVQCNGQPPCAAGESAVGYLASEGRAVVHEHASVEGGRFSLEIWDIVVRRNVAATGVTLSDDPNGCFQASRIHLVGPVQDVTSRCATVDRAVDAYAYLACEAAKRGMDP
jgi:hypothetical protein